MAPPAANTTAHAGSAEKLKRCVVSLDQTKYLVTPVTLHRLLEMTFNRAFDLNTISVSTTYDGAEAVQPICQISATDEFGQERHHRLIYYAERELDRAEIEYAHRSPRSQRCSKAC